MKKFKFKIDGSIYEVSVNEVEQNIAEIEVNGTPFTVEIERQEKTSVSSINRKPAGKVTPIQTPSRNVIASAIKAPLPGSIMKVLVTAGQKVKRGDLLLTMESMKMENNILAEHDGTINTVHVQSGQTVMQDDVLIDFVGAETEVAAAPVSALVNDDQPLATPAPKPSAGSKPVKSPLPGNVLRVDVAVGQSVKRGDLLLVLESMKMENNILAEKDAVVRNIYVKAGQTVMQDDVLFDLE